MPSGYAGAYPEVGRRLGRGRGQAVPVPARCRSHGGGLLLRWRERGTVMVVSVTGNLAAHQRLLLVLAGHLTLLPPKR